MATYIQPWYNAGVEEVQAVFYSPIKHRHSINHLLPQQKLAKVECRCFVLENTMTQTKEERKAKARAYYIAHKEKRNVQSREYHTTYREERNAYSRMRRILHHEEVRASERKYYVAHKEESRVYARTYSHKHHEEILAKSRARRLEVLTHYGGKCVCCGEDTFEFLAIDHTNGGGNKHRKEIKSSGSSINIDRWLKKNNYPAGFQVLCHNCNLAKGFYGSCPHKAKAV